MLSVLVSGHPAQMFKIQFKNDISIKLDLIRY